ncbi:V-type proton ATPase subunit H [Strongyloides ratti]|uniref:V-type proton ATPase subunit H n=1 Tax=Strongyloides ratti TaxID=34506 RepID=A0A090L3F1_STRRB|nr:V-type proton ATPase subunit H [Strongyloides ratti]CEF64336.1 V-type proton ATPase subunit H [Strongyloides ratti]
MGCSSSKDEKLNVFISEKNMTTSEDVVSQFTPDMISATSHLQIQANEVRNRDKPNWSSYLRSDMIKQEDYDFVINYEKCTSREARQQFILQNQMATANTFISLITNISKVPLVKYSLVMLDDLLSEDKTRAEVFKGDVLNNPDLFIKNQMAIIIAKIACNGGVLMTGTDLNVYFSLLKEELKNKDNKYINTATRCLQMMLRVDKYRFEFVKGNGIMDLAHVLNNKINFQLQYQIIFCFWCLTFNEKLAKAVQHAGVIPLLVEILSETTKEKVMRIILATFRNIIEKIEDREIVRESALQMVQCKTMKTLELLENKKLEDTDIVEDIEFLNQKLQASVQDLSSFDEYVTELRSGRLQWSPVHKSDKFWKENAQRLNEKNFELVKLLISKLEEGDPLTQCVAAHDIGEYVRHYPRGKTVIENQDGKGKVMKLLSAEDPNVRYHALLAIQKLMVHNWEYLGKQLDADKGKESVPN